jgi:hypothetical protein
MKGTRILKQMVEQCATRIFLPNQKADSKDYIDGFKVTEAEYDIIRTLGKASRPFSQSPIPPACFDSPMQYAAWKGSRRPPQGKMRTCWFCEDCLPDRQQQMQAVGRCAHPGIRFKRDQDGFVHGYLPS